MSRTPASPETASSLRHRIARAAVVALALTLPAGTALAKEEFAKRTGQECNACHTRGYPLTPLGRAFKANGNRMPCRTATLRLYDAKGHFLRTHTGCFPTWGPKVTVGQ